jgi:hypothetical protein
MFPLLVRLFQMTRSTSLVRAIREVVLVRLVFL